MKEHEQQVHVQEPGTYTFRYGADEQKNSDHVSTSTVHGPISAPASYLEGLDAETMEKRKEIIVFYNEERGKINLYLNWRTDSQIHICGRMSASKHVEMLKLNSDVPWNPHDLAKTLKMMMPYAVDSSAVNTIIDQLKRLQVKIQTVKRDVQDDSEFENSVQTMITDIKLNRITRFRFPLYKGEEDTEIEVEIVLMAEPSGVNIQLWSTDLIAKKYYQQVDAIDREIEKLENLGINCVKGEIV